MLPERLRPLLVRAAYGHDVDEVEFIETHISWVLLAGAHAYKIKKPVRFAFLDYSTLERRRLMCEREVELNRRGCRDAYVGVLPICDSPAGARMGGHGPIIEYAVEMLRLSRAGWLSAAVERGEASAQLLRRVARAVYEFHADAATGAEVARFGSAAETSRIWHEN